MSTCEPARRPDLVLLGLRASGKSTLGRAAADLAGAPFFDLDQLVTERSGCASVADAFRHLGEARFRDLEAETLADLLAARADARRDDATHGPAVIALGGGTPTAPGVASRLQTDAAAGRLRLLLLDATPATLAARIRADGDGRPSLTGAGPAEEVEAVAAARLPLYRALAQVCVDTDSLDPPAALRAVEAAWLA